MSEPELRWMLLEEAADVLGISTKRVMAMYSSDGILATRKRFGDTWLFLRSEVMHRKAHPARAYHRANVLRCPRCDMPVKEGGALCEDCLRELAPPEPEPEEPWQVGTFDIVNPAYHGVGG